MGFLIFLAGSKRYSMPSATYLMHDGSTMGWDSTAKMKDRMDFETNQVEKYTKNYIISRTKIDSKIYDKKYRMEWYMYPTEAKEYGVCTHIIGQDCDIDEII
jgi:ATP-dependent protease ClpP protease subunit